MGSKVTCKSDLNSSCVTLFSVFGYCPFSLLLFKTLRRKEAERGQGGGLCSVCPKKADSGATQCQTQERQE